MIFGIEGLPLFAEIAIIVGSFGAVMAMAPFYRWKKKEGQN